MGIIRADPAIGLAGSPREINSRGREVIQFPLTELVLRHDSAH